MRHRIVVPNSVVARCQGLWRWVVGIALFASSGGLLFGASLTASLDREAVAVGEGVTLFLVFEGGAPASVPAIQAPPNVSVQYGGKSEQWTIVNGRTSSKVTHQFSLSAKQAGDYVIGPFGAVVGAENLTAPAVRLSVTSGGNGGNNGDGAGRLAFLRLVTPKPNVYVGEVFPIEVQLYLGVNYDNVEMPQLQGDGFVFGKIPQPTGTRTQLGGRMYVVFPFKMTATAVKAGQLSLGPAQCNVALQVPVNRRGRDVFEDFFGPRVQRTPVTVASDPQIITVNALPTVGRPAAFNGAIGNFALTAHASPTNLAAGDPITLRLQVSGRGNLDSLPFPAGPDWANFKLYPPTSKTESADPLGIAGVKSFERVVIPQGSEVKEIPAIAFAFFDPDQKAYRTVTSPALPIVVQASERGEPRPMVSAGNKPPEESATPSQGLVANKPYLGVVTSLQEPIIMRPWFISLQLVPLAAWFGAWIWKRRQSALQSNPRLRRRRQVAEEVKRGTRELLKLAQANESDGFFAAVFRLMQEQLGERLDLPASAITEAVLDEKLRRRAPDELVQQLHELFQLCNQARYAPHRSTRELLELVPVVERSLAQLRDLPFEAKS